MDIRASWLNSRDALHVLVASVMKFPVATEHFKGGRLLHSCIKCVISNITKRSSILIGQSCARVRMYAQSLRRKLLKDPGADLSECACMTDKSLQCESRGLAPCASCRFLAMTFVLFPCWNLFTRWADVSCKTDASTANLTLTAVI